MNKRKTIFVSVSMLCVLGLSGFLCGSYSNRESVTETATMTDAISTEDITIENTTEEIKKVSIHKNNRNYIAEEMKRRGKEHLKQLEEAEKNKKNADTIESVPTTGYKDLSKGGTATNSDACRYYTLSEFKSKGVINYGGYRLTYYSETVLPGGGLNIPGRHVDEEGWVVDGDGYICVAAYDLPKGTVITLPFARNGKVYDRCGAADIIDCYIH